MLQEFAKYLVDKGEEKPYLFDIGGRQYSNRALHEIKGPKFPTEEVRTLDGLIELCGRLGEEPHYVVVESPTSVAVKLEEIDEWGRRDTVVQASARVTEFRFGRSYSQSEFIIALQTQFVDTDTTAALLKLVGNIIDEASVQQEDDGVSQKVTARSGIARVENIKVPNPVKLRPYRTFPEIEQPESQYVFRMQKAGDGVTMTLHEADGGMWAIDAMNDVAEYLKSNLEGTTVIA